MERKYTETDKELMLKLLEMQELTAPISLSIGSVVDGQVTQGIILHEAPPIVVEDLTVHADMNGAHGQQSKSRPALMVSSSTFATSAKQSKSVPSKQLRHTASLHGK